MPVRNIIAAMPASTPSSASFSVTSELVGRGGKAHRHAIPSGCVSDLTPATDGDPGGAGSESEPASEGVLAGRRLVVGLYLIVVAIAAFIGLVLGLIAPQGLDPRLFGVIALPPTPLGMAAYGGITLAVVLGALLAAVAYVSRRYDDAEPGEARGGN